MPRITAPTVAEHRSRRRDELIQAATEELLESGVDAVTLARVGKRIGLARSSVYEYFNSATDLLAEIALGSFAEWTGEIERALAGSATASERLDGYIFTSLRLVAEGKHDVADALGGTRLPDYHRREVIELHVALMSPLRDAVDQMGVENPSLMVELIQGLVEAGSRRIARGDDYVRVARATISLVHSGLTPATPADPSVPSDASSLTGTH
ncbi:TetR/AcrR family transcriptional regulator [Mycetocola tolaasinivorans]|uniref:TetR/AcrR family transcriptional regulator n=1 Tax=Mycetocola tolaasinivorans TaxID=76635 RepID=A0A3L7AE11_9MICO|nr:TetR/AcrR family transcriptional regulator [Mycetocola tolaasinivorans]RLP78040.1 TetR/AcrR family transcriptional regulator [Mycetocola tolaasinivorans]